MNEPIQKRELVVDAALIAAGGLIVVTAAVWWTATASRRGADLVAPGSVGAVGAGREAGYLGDRACAGCHPGESALHRQSGHSKTLRSAGATDVARRLDGRTFRDPEYPGVTWSYALRGGRLSVARRDTGDGGEIERFVIDYAFGSGAHAVTFVSVTERDPRRPAGVEHRLTSYTGEQTLDVTPGHGLTAPMDGVTPRGRPLTPSKLLRCFRCHTTTSTEGRDVLDVAAVVPNVTCERCHGPARDHVAAARRGASAVGAGGRLALGAGRWTAEGQMRACGECHRHPSQAPPGDIRTDNIEIVRYQPVGLMQSRCYTRSGGGMSCVTCHDPHAPASHDRAGYEAVCRSCHSAAPQTTCRVSPLDRCLDCHMPRRNSGQGVPFTDHWIRVGADGSAAPGAGAGRPSNDP